MESLKAFSPVKSALVKADMIGLSAFEFSKMIFCSLRQTFGSRLQQSLAISRVAVCPTLELVAGTTTALLPENSSAGSAACHENLHTFVLLNTAISMARIAWVSATTINQVWCKF